MKAGGPMWLLYLAWKHAGACPFRTYRQLDGSYRPIGDPQAEPMYPADPRRVRNVVFAFALQAEEDALAHAGGSAARAAGR